jgi:streptogramin lyase
MMDDKGHVWLTTQIRDSQDQPKWENSDIVYQSGYAPPQGAQGSGNGMTMNAEGERVSATSSGRQLGYFDIKTQKFVLVNTIYGTHHLQFDSQGRLWTSLDPRGLGMFDPSKFDPSNPTETEGQAQKLYMKVDQKTGKPTSGGGYGIAVNPVDQTIWRANPQAAGMGNKLNKFDPKTMTFTDYPLPAPGRGPRGVDVTTDGKIWFATGSGHLGRFDPTTEKFTYWELPGPKLKGTGPETGSAEMPYYLWVDQFNALGMGKDKVIATGTNSDSLVVFDPSTEKFTVIRVPYPLSFYHRGLDGRIDDANAGWKGRGLWADYGEDPIMFVEKTHMGSVVHVQMRPDPLAH